MVTMSEPALPRTDSTAPRRGRGRPKGSAPYRAGDLEALSIFADHEIEMPGAHLAPFLAKRGYSDRGVRRAQALWRRESQQLLGAAQLRFDSRRPETLVDVLFAVASAVRAIGQAIVDSELVDCLRASMNRAQARRKAEEQLNVPSILPFDPINTGDLKAALAHFEPEMHGIGSPALTARLSNKTLADLPASERTYLMAVLLHALSLEERQREIEAEGAGSAGAESKIAGASR
jgi:hypothetical protein